MVSPNKYMVIGKSKRMGSMIKKKPSIRGEEAKAKQVKFSHIFSTVGNEMKLPHVIKGDLLSSSQTPEEAAESLNQLRQGAIKPPIAVEMDKHKEQEGEQTIRPTIGGINIRNKHAYSSKLQLQVGHKKQSNIGPIIGGEASLRGKYVQSQPSNSTLNESNAQVGQKQQSNTRPTIGGEASLRGKYVQEDQPSNSTFNESSSQIASKSSIDAASNGKKRGRGRTRNLALAKMQTNEKFEITWRHKRAVGKFSQLFKSKCTTLVRQVQNAPLNVENWAQIPEEKKMKMFHLIQKVSKRNKTSRSMNVICHTSGSKSFMQTAEEEKEKSGQEIGRLRLWEITHAKLNGQAVNKSTQEKLHELKSLASEVNEGSTQMNEDEIFVKVFGPERHGRVRGFGAGATPTDLWGPKSSSTIICDLESKLQQSEMKHEESDAKVKILEDKMNRIEDMLAQLLSGKVTQSNVETSCFTSVEVEDMPY